MRIKPATGPLRGQLTLPGDKSISHRAILLASLSQEKSEIFGCLDAADTRATVQACRRLGAQIVPISPRHLAVTGVGLQPSRSLLGRIDCGNSGTTMRLLAGVVAGKQCATELVGDNSLNNRPMARVINPLREMGARVTSHSEGTAPLSIAAGYPLRGIRYVLPVASAQVKSALLLAGLFAEGETQVVESVVTRDHTELMLPEFGVIVEKFGVTHCIKKTDVLRAASIQVPGDCSSAAFFAVAACLVPGSDLVLKNVGLNPTRTGFINILLAMGAKIDIVDKYYLNQELVGDIRIKYQKLQGVSIVTDIISLAIDELPVILVAAAMAEGITVLQHAEELRHKETDRLAAMATGLQQLGIQLEVLPDGLVVYGGQLSGGVVDSFGDHRIAMAFAIAGLAANKEVNIRQSACIKTSFPGFIECAQSAGADIMEDSRDE